MGATDTPDATGTPLTDILAQLRARAEAWGRESAAARAALAEEVAHARQALESQAAELREMAPPAPSVDPPLQPALEAALAENTALQAQLAEAERENDALRARIADLEAENALLKTDCGEKVDATQLHAAQAALSEAEHTHRAAIAALEARIAEQAAALTADTGEKVDASALQAAHEALSQAELARCAEVETLEGRIEVQEATIASLRAEVAALHVAAGRDEAARALAESEIPAFDKQGHKRRMGVILVEAGVLTQEQLEEALAEQAADPHRRFGAIVVERGYTTEEAIARILAAQLRLPFVTLAPGSYDASAPRLISAHLARLHKAVPIRQQDGVLTVAMANPLDLIAIEDIEIASRNRVEPVVATKSGIEALLAQTV